MDLGVVMESARSPSWRQRAEAARTLAKVDDAQALSVVDELLTDSDVSVVQAAAESLLQRGDVRSVSRFTKAYASADDQVGDHMNDVLAPAAVSQPGLVAVLRTLAEDDDAGASAALAWLGLPQAP